MAFDAIQGSNIIDMGFHKLPALDVSSLKYLSGTSRFIVTIGLFTFGFKSVSGLSVERPMSGIEEGGVNDHAVLVGNPNTSVQNLTFSRGLMIRFPDILDKGMIAAAVRVPTATARFGMLMAAAATSPQSTLERGPAMGMVRVYDRNGNLRGKYSFTSYGISSWKVSDLDAMDNNILIEDLTIVHTGLTREPITMVPSSIASIGAISGSYRTGIDDNRRRAEEKLNYQKYRKEWAEKLGDLEKEKENKENELKKIRELKDKLAKGELDEEAIKSLSGVSESVKAMLQKSLEEKEIRDQQEANTKAREAIKEKIRKGEELTEADMEGMSEEAKEAFKKELGDIESRKAGAIRDEAKRQELDEYTKNLEEEKSWKSEDAQKASEEQEAKNVEMRSKQIEQNTKENYEKARDERKAQIEEQNKKRAEEIEASEKAKAATSEAINKRLEDTKEEREEAEKKAEELRQAHAEQLKEQAKRDSAERKKLDKKVESKSEKQEALKKYLEATKSDREKAQQKANKLRKEHEKQAKKQAQKDKESREDLNKYNEALNNKKDAKAKQQQKLADKQNEDVKKNREESLKND